MRKAVSLRHLCLSPLAFLAACASSTSSNAPPSDFVYKKGTGTLNEIHADLRYIVIDTPDGPLKAWWNESSRFYLGRTQVQSLSILPGDRVHYIGFLSYNELYLRTLVQDKP